MKRFFIKVKRIDSDTVMIKALFHGWACYVNGTLEDNIADYIADYM